MRTNSSAAPSETSKGGSAFGCCALPFDVSAMRKTFLARCQNYRHDAATLFNSLDRKFHFPLNQDTTALPSSLSISLGMCPLGNRLVPLNDNQVLMQASKKECTPAMFTFSLDKPEIRSVVESP